MGNWGRGYTRIRGEWMTARISPGQLFCLLPLSVAIAGAYAEHVQIGLMQVPYTLHIPVQMVLPAALLGIQLVKARLAR